MKSSISSSKAKALSGVAFFSVFIVIAFFLVSSHLKERVEFIQNYKSSFIHENFEKKKSEIERFYTLTYQSLRTVSLLPGVRSITGGNRKNEKEDLVGLGRFPKESALTVQQLFNNLAGNVSVSEIYAVIDGFAPEKGEVPFFMYDTVLVTDLKKKEEEKVKTPDTPEQSEEEEYAFYKIQLEEFRSSSIEFKYSDDLNWIPASSSSIMRTCDNAQYLSIKNGQVADSFGIVYSVPFFNYTGKFKGLISAVIRKNVIEAILTDMPVVPITEEDQKKVVEAKVQLTKSASNFGLLRKNKPVFFSDRRVSPENHFEQFAMNVVSSKVENEHAYYEKLQIQDQDEWYLFYDFRDEPWAKGVKELTKILFLKLTLLGFIFGTLLFVRYSQKKKVRDVASQIHQSISTLTQALLNASNEAQGNSKTLSELSETLSSSTSEIASSVHLVQGSAQNNLTLANEAKDHFDEMKEQITQGEMQIDQLHEAMELILKSGEKIKELLKITKDIDEKAELINDVVTKSQLLSFNASIEAARAGEHGKSFSVVANEMTSLSKLTGDSAAQIISIIKVARGAASSVYEQNSKSINVGEVCVNKLSAIIKDISTKAELVASQISAVSERSGDQNSSMVQIGQTVEMIQKVALQNESLAKKSLDLGKILENQTKEQSKAVKQISSLID